MKRASLTLAACIALALTSGGVASATVAAGTGRAVTAAEQLPDGDAPPGFWWGTDSLPVTVPGSAPYSMPYLGGAYGGYIGMTGNWAYWLGCTGAEHFLADVLGTDRLIYAVDYPFVGNDGAVDFLLGADLPEAVKEDIAHRNAERLLGGSVLG
jgi:hypothetical protein